MVSSDFPASWTQVYLENIVEILDSMRVPVNSDDRSSRVKDKSQSQLYPYYGATGEVGKIDGYIFDEELVALGEDGVPFFDTQKTKAYLLQGKTWVNNHAHVLKAKEQVAINKYILHYLNQFDYQGYVNGGTRLKLTQANMRKIPIALAPLSEQKVIANKLDDMLAKVERIKARLEGIPQILKELRQSALADAVSGKLTKDWRDKSNSNWIGEINKLGDLIELAYGRSLPAKIRSGNDYPVFGSNGEVGRHNEKLIDGPFIIVGRKGSYGEIVWSSGAGWPIDTTYYVVLKQNANLRFVYYLLQTLGLNQLNRSTAIPGLNREDAYIRPIRIPPLEEQNEIARRVDEIFIKISRIEKQARVSLDKVNNLTQSILSKAFRGELTERWRAENQELISVENSAEALLNRINDEKIKSDNSIKDLKISINLPLPPIDIKMRAIVSPNKIIKVKDAFNVDSNDEDHILSGQELLLAAGYPNDADAETLEKFYLDLRASLNAGEIVKLNRADGQDWFALTKYLDKQ